MMLLAPYNDFNCVLGRCWSGLMREEGMAVPSCCRL